MLDVKDRAIALKALVHFLLASGPTRTLTKLLQQHPGLDDRKRSVVQSFRSFASLGTTPSLTAEELDSFVTATQRFVDTQHIAIPPHFQAAARAAGLRLGPSRSHERSSFINYGELPAIAGTIDQNRELIAIYQGCWRVFRLSSSTFRDDEPKLNQAFLNIKPIDVLYNQNIQAPVFSLDQRSELRSDILRSIHAAGLTNSVKPSVNRIFGNFMQTGDFITLIGEREQVSLGMPMIGMMVWLNVAIGRVTTRVTQFSGLSLIPNAEGRQVASYFYASFIPGSDRLSGKEYDELRDRQLTQLRAYPHAELPDMEEKLAPKIYDALLSQSRTSYVLTA